MIIFVNKNKISLRDAIFIKIKGSLDDLMSPLLFWRHYLPGLVHLQQQEQFSIFFALFYYSSTFSKIFLSQ